jgi:prepilin-type N-terminal cleavage/methylation domain-containing protein/prepilin-type processing-associated H-X9-DG protein
MKRHRAFTLVELLVVIGIISVLVAILLPSLSRARAQASRISCTSGMRQIFLFATMYANENRDRYPPYNISTAATVFGYTDSAPYSWWLLDRYSQVQYDPTGSVGAPGKLGYDTFGPTSNNIYFCKEFRDNHVRSSAIWNGFGYAVNWNCTGDFYPTGPGTAIIQWPWDGIPRTRARISSPSYTIFMRELNPPVTYDQFISGPDVWPLNPITHTNPNTFDTKYSRLHMGGQNILYADGHIAWYKYPNNVEGQIFPGFNERTYSTYPGWSWQW